MPFRDVSEFLNTEAEHAFEAYQQQMLPDLVANLEDHLFEPGRESELFVALNHAFCDRLDQDDVSLPREEKFKLLFGLGRGMPMFAVISDVDKSALLKSVFDGRETKPQNPLTP